MTMRITLALLLLVSMGVQSFGVTKEVTDTFYTLQNDKVIINYIVSNDAQQVVFDALARPRVIPSASLRKMCKDGNLDNIKVVIFDRVGNYRDVKWRGLTPDAFMVPAALDYQKSSDGFYILGESSPMVFGRITYEAASIDMPIFIAIYEKKQNYRIVSRTQQPLIVDVKATQHPAVTGSQDSQVLTVTSEEVIETDNETDLKALKSANLVKEMLATATQLPFSQLLEAELANMRSIAADVANPEVIDKINEVMLEYANKEKELTSKQDAEAQAAKEAEVAALAQQKQEELQRQEEAKKEAQLQEEKQQKRTIWMIIGGALFMVLCFVGNAVFKHFRDLSNQRSLMEMQQSIAQQAERQASRRAKEIIHNKANQTVNQGKTALREKAKTLGKKNNNSNKIRTI